MYMSNDEIIKYYDEAKDKNNAIKILSDINMCSWNEIKGIISIEKSIEKGYDFDKIQQLYNSGLNDREIAKIVGTSSSFIFYWRQKNGLPKNRMIDEEAALSLYQEGLSDGKIAKRLNVPTTSIFRWRVKKGLPCNIPPSRKDYRK